MSKKNSKKRWNNQHQEMLKREKEEAAKKAEKAAKKAQKDHEEAGGMLVDGEEIPTAAAAAAASKRGATRKTRGAHALKASTLKVASTGASIGKSPVNKNTRKVLKGVPVGLAQRKLKLRKGTVVRGIKITDADSKNKVLDELKAEMAMGMMVDGVGGEGGTGFGERLSTKQVHARRNQAQKMKSKTKVRVTGNEFQGKLMHHKVKCGVPGG